MAVSSDEIGQGPPNPAMGATVDAAPDTQASELPQNDLQSDDIGGSSGDTTNESEVEQPRVNQCIENEISNQTTAIIDSTNTTCDQNASNMSEEIDNYSDNISPDRNTYDISHNSGNQELSDLPTDESNDNSSKENGAICDILRETDPNSSFTEESIDSLGNDCYEAEDESDARLQTNSNSEEQSSLGYNDADNFESEEISAGDDNNTSKFSDNNVVVQEPKVVIDDNLIEISLPNSSINKDNLRISPKSDKKKLHQIPIFKNRIGSIRKNKKATNAEFSIEIYESKRPMSYPQLQDQLSFQTGSTGCLTQTDILRSREERAHSEPPELKSTDIIPSFEKQTIPENHSKLDKDCLPSSDPSAETTLSTSIDTGVSSKNQLSKEQDDEPALESTIDPAAQLGGITLDGSTTLSQTSESSSGVTGELTSTGNIDWCTYYAVQLLSSFDKKHVVTCIVIF